ncbi:hypothetical protein SAMN05216344_10552 [Polaromonas sp. OV174]|nr:hypothetical protein SAMN05216344_10552 [Polaromonas sp. OV174]
MTPNIPADFPREPYPGAIPGAQPKFIARKMDGRFVVGLTDEELQERYDVCAELIQQLIPYCVNKQRDNPAWTTADILLRVADGVTSQGWGQTPPEIDWIVGRIADELGWPPLGIKARVR